MVDTKKVTVLGISLCIMMSLVSGSNWPFHSQEVVVETNASRIPRGLFAPGYFLPSWLAFDKVYGEDLDSVTWEPAMMNVIVSIVLGVVDLFWANVIFEKVRRKTWGEDLIAAIIINIPYLLSYVACQCLLFGRYFLFVGQEIVKHETRNGQILGVIENVLFFAAGLIFTGWYWIYGERPIWIHMVGLVAWIAALSVSIARAIIFPKENVNIAAFWAFSTPLSLSSPFACACFIAWLLTQLP